MKVGHVYIMKYMLMKLVEILRNTGKERIPGSFNIHSAMVEYLYPFDESTYATHYMLINIYARPHDIWLFRIRLHRPHHAVRHIPLYITGAYRKEDAYVNAVNEIRRRYQ